MSTPQVIAAVTTRLQALLAEEIPKRDDLLQDIQVTTDSPDRARATLRTSQVNLYLYQTAVNAGWRNLDTPPPPRPPRSSGVGHPPLALNLFYLLTAYGRGDADTNAISQRVLGSAMSVLHDFPLLGADVADQIERVRITPQPFSIEDISKLWTAFQTSYRLSAAYEATVVLIDSLRSARSALPVLQRGPSDDNASVGADLRVPFPTILGIEHQTDTAQPSFLPGDAIRIRGDHLDGAQVTVDLDHASAPAPRTVAPASATATTIELTLPSDAAWPAGVHRVTVLVQRPNVDPRRTGAMPIVVAPRIAGLSLGNVTRDADGTRSFPLTVACHHDVQPGQRAAILFGDREIGAAPFTAATRTLTFAVSAVLPGDYYVRLRIEGVDSLLVKTYAQKPWVFDPGQRVTVP